MIYVWCITVWVFVRLLVAACKEEEDGVGGWFICLLKFCGSVNIFCSSFLYILGKKSALLYVYVFANNGICSICLLSLC